MKNIYLVLVIALGIGASVFVYMASQGSTESSINTLSKTSSKFAKSINACKNAYFEIDGQKFQLKNEIAEVIDKDVPAGKITLRYNNHAVRGYMDSGASNDMVCTYDMIDGSNNVKTYVGVLLGFTEDSFAAFNAVLLGQNIVVNDMKIEGARAIISTKDVSTGSITIKKVFIEEDMLSVI